MTPRYGSNIRHSLSPLQVFHLASRQKCLFKALDKPQVRVVSYLIKIETLWRYARAPYCHTVVILAAVATTVGSIYHYLNVGKAAQFKRGRARPPRHCSVSLLNWRAD